MVLKAEDIPGWWAGQTGPAGKRRGPAPPGGVKGVGAAAPADSLCRHV